MFINCLQITATKKGTNEHARFIVNDNTDFLRIVIEALKNNNYTNFCIYDYSKEDRTKFYNTVHRLGI